MANKDQRRNKEVRKAKQPKAKVAPAVSTFIVTPGKTPAGARKD
jgi:hypothetical protein